MLDLLYWHLGAQQYTKLGATNFAVAWFGASLWFGSTNPDHSATESVKPGNIWKSYCIIPAPPTYIVFTSVFFLLFHFQLFIFWFLFNEKQTKWQNCWLQWKWNGQQVNHDKNRKTVKHCCSHSMWAVWRNMVSFNLTSRDYIFPLEKCPLLSSYCNLQYNNWRGPCNKDVSTNFFMIFLVFQACKQGEKSGYTCM